MLFAFAPSVSTGSAAVISSAGPLSRINISADLNCEVNHVADAHTEFYGGTACATLMAADGTLYGPQNIPAGGTAGSTGGANPRTAWTPVSQEGPTGSGTEADPFRVTTVVRGGPFRVTEVDTYVIGEESYRADVTVKNDGGDAANVILYRAGDCYLQNSDYGFGRIDGDAPTCVAQGPDGTPGDRIEQFTPITAGSRHYQAGYWEVWEHIGTRQPFPNTCRCHELIDNGAGISWSRAIPPGEERRFSSLITFSPLGVVPLVITKAADDESIEAGGSTGFTITVTNPNVRDVTLTELNDDLPTGFSYLAGSTSGATKEDPEINGQRLTWRDLVVPAHDVITLHFTVRVSDTPGSYVNTASGVGVGVVVVPAEEVAVLVTESTLDRPDIFLEKSPDDPTTIAATHNGYTITVSNPSAKALPLTRLVERLGEGFSYVAGSTTGITTKDPVIDGRELTWHLDHEVPPFSAVQLHFVVRVPLAPGTKKNPLIDVDPNGEKKDDTAPIRVIPGPVLGALHLRKFPHRRSIRAGERVRFTLVVRDLAPKTATKARICDRLPRQLRLVSARGAQVRGREVCWRRVLPAGEHVRRVFYVARAAPGTAGRAASTATATAFRRDPDRARAGVTIRPLLAPPPIVTG